EVYSEIFKVQSNIANQVVEALDITLFDREQKALDSKPTDNMKAYDYYLRGLNFECRSFTREDYTSAIRMYEQAIDFDSSFVLAWAQLSIVHTEMYWFYHDRSKERLVKAENAINRAININPDLPGVQYALGRYFYHGKGDYKKALDQFIEVQKFLPNDSRIFLSIGAVLRRQDKFNDALPYFLKALELDPKSATYLFEMAGTYYDMRNYNEAERFYNQAISLAPDWPTPYHFKALLYLSWYGSKEKSQQVYEEALIRMNPTDFISKSQMSEERTLWKIIDNKYLLNLLKTTKNHFLTNSELYYLFKAELYDRLKQPQRAYSYYDSSRVVLENKLKKLNKDGSIHINLALSYGGMGKKNKAIEEGNLALKLLPMSKDANEAPLIIKYYAQLLTNVGEYDAAIDQLEVLVSIMSSKVTVPWLRVDPTWDIIRDNPRFQELTK
ncbi:tetratricopeptide repeat protein, partial [bacterium]|nr:tetratricopeptide repeat protein [bacterium]